MVPNERPPTHTKGTTMFLDLFYAVSAFVAVGAAVNYIGHVISK